VTTRDWPILFFKQAQLHASQTPKERSFRSDLAAGKGENNAKANLRLFDYPEGTEPRITFYRDRSLLIMNSQ
jgi:hypothetical protein